MGLMEKIEGCGSLQQQTIPKVKREVFACAAQASNEVVIKGLNCLFRHIAILQMWRNELEVDAFGSHETF
jgi:hypothetical protein